MINQSDNVDKSLKIIQKERFFSAIQIYVNVSTIFDNLHKEKKRNGPLYHFV